jgi:hypothetical protein
VAVCPTVTVWVTGCALIEGATEAAVTVRAAGLLVMLPTELLTVTVKSALLSAVAVAGVV